MKNHLLIALTLLFLTACAEKKAILTLDDGYLEGSTYNNEYLNFSIDIPEDWVIQNRDVLTHLKDQSKKVFKANDDATNRAIQDSVDNRTRTLLMALQFEFGAPVRFNPSTIVLAEDVSVTPGIKKGSDYLFHAKTLLQNSNMAVSFPRDSYQRELGSHTFDVLPIELNVNGIKIQQLYHATIVGRFALNIIASYETEAELANIQAILDSIRAIEE